MSAESEITTALCAIIGELLEIYDAKVPVEGQFGDVRVKRQVYYGDPDTTTPGMLEGAIMCMDEKLNPANREVRFLAIRVRKSARGGVVSTTCFHGDKASLKANLERELQNPAHLVYRVEELATGLPEETNPNLWR